MGQVWVARDGSLGRQIALKELRPEQTDNSTVCSRFLYEAKITAQLEHPGIVPVYELGGGPVPFYTMRFVKGRTLREATRAYHKERAAGAVDSLALANLLTRVSRSLPRHCVRPLAGSDPSRSEGAERDPGRLWRGHRARLGHRQADRPAHGQLSCPDRKRWGIIFHQRFRRGFRTSRGYDGTLNPQETLPEGTNDPASRACAPPRLGGWSRRNDARPASGNSWIHGARASRWPARPDR